MAKPNTSPTEFYRSGTLVHPKLINVRGMIVRSADQFGIKMYEVKYYINGEPRYDWMHENEFTTKATKQKIGFK